ncbi:MAG: hypothetical protein HY741_21620 [Chloroflexi bacterium]|nr:hypothetical protein [Chloroflexota bacterium]
MPNVTKAKTASKLAPAQALFEKIVREISSDAGGVSSAKMMGMPCLKVKGKMFAGYWRDAMVFKLNGDAHKKALGLADAHLFDPSEMNRPMKEWVVVPYTHKAKWRAFAQNALDYVASKL